MSDVTPAEVEALRRRVERERRARKEAEALLESKSLELFEANTAVTKVSHALEGRVADLEVERARVTLLARTDSLTGLVNRRAFSQSIIDGLASAAEAGASLALMIIDVDRFKAVNDAFGHHGGDELLLEIAARLNAFVGAGDMVGRLGGDEFGVVMTLPRDPSGERQALTSMATRLLETLRRPLDVGGRRINASGSVGIALFPDDGDDAEDLQRFADVALYRAKSLGRDTWSAFDDSLRDEISRRQTLEVDLRRAMEDGEITPWFQPIFDCQSGRVSSVEALARWNHPQRGVVGPDVFIPLAEDLGIIAELDERLFDIACRTARPWVEAGLIDHVACNVSPRALLANDFSAKLIRRLKDTGLPPSGLVVEITETFLMQDMAAARRHIERLTSVGVRCALDDFGTGYSNLRALLALPIDKIKIDRSLLADFGGNPRVAKLLRALFQTARALGVSVVAEGVEHEGEAIFLRASGCTWMQGFLFHQPAPAKIIDALLRGGGRARRTA